MMHYPEELNSDLRSIGSRRRSVNGLKKEQEILDDARFDQLSQTAINDSIKAATNRPLGQRQ